MTSWRVETGGGVTTARWYRASEAAQRVSLLLAPGAGAGQDHPFMVALASAIAARGADVVTFDFLYVASGRRRPDPPAVLERTWLDAIDSVRRHPDLRAQPLFLGGKSMGGRVATHVAARVDAATLGIAGVVCLGYPLHPPGRTTARSVDHFANVQVPVLVLQGTRDRFGGPDDLAVAAGPTRARLTIRPVEGADHGFAVPKRCGTTKDAVLARIAADVVEWATAEGGTRQRT